MESDEDKLTEGRSKLTSSTVVGVPALSIERKVVAEFMGRSRNIRTSESNCGTPARASLIVCAPSGYDRSLGSLFLYRVGIMRSELYHAKLCPDREAPISGVTNVRERWMNTTYFELVVDGNIVDLNRIPLPADTPIVDERFKGKDGAGK